MALKDEWRGEFLEVRMQYIGALAAAGYSDAEIANVLDMSDVMQVTLIRMTAQEKGYGNNGQPWDDARGRASREG